MVVTSKRKCEPLLNLVEAPYAYSYQLQIHFTNDRHLEFIVCSDNRIIYQFCFKIYVVFFLLVPDIAFLLLSDMTVGSLFDNLKLLLDHILFFSVKSSKFLTN